jgi:hypothetical protein
MTRYAKSHTQIDLARRSILLTGRRSCCTWSSNKLHFCWRLRDLIPGLQWDHNASWTYTFGLQEPSASGGRKHGGRKNNDHWTHDEFRRIVHPDARRFWATFPGHSCEQGVCHKDSSSSCVRGMSNPITRITRILLETERSRRRKKREKQKLRPIRSILCAIARSKSREEGSKWLTLLYQKKEPYS